MHIRADLSKWAMLARGVGGERANAQPTTQTERTFRMTRRTLSLKSPPPQGKPVDDFIEKCCGNCRFWEDEHGECRRRAPYRDPKSGGVSWPIASPHDWCGDFKRLPCPRPSIHDDEIAAAKLRAALGWLHPELELLWSRGDGNGGEIFEMVKREAGRG